MRKENRWPKKVNWRLFWTKGGNKMRPIRGEGPVAICDYITTLFLNFLSKYISRQKLLHFTRPGDLYFDYDSYIYVSFDVPSSLHIFTMAITLYCSFRLF